MKRREREEEGRDRNKGREGGGERERENEGDDDDTLDDPIQLVVEAGHGVRGLRSTENQQVLQRIMCGTSQNFLQIINQYSGST